MGQGASSQPRSGEVVGAKGGRVSSKLKERLQVLEDLVQGTSKQRKQELLRELAASSGCQPTAYGILPRAPEEFKLGALIAAGSYGRVYAGTYRGQPAALKLLILDEESAAAILNEVRLCLKLNHRNLVRLLDCAVVSTSSRQFSTTSSLEGTPAGWLYSSEQQGYSYHPMLISEQQDSCSPAASHSSCQQPGFKELARATSLDQANHTTGSELLHLDGRGFGLTSPSGHACFEVWIAMELCDGGTLAEQVARGFQYCPQSHHVDLELLLTVALDIARALSYMHAEHVCHGDLKAENVLLKVLHAGTGADSASECSWLQMLCHSSSSSHITRRCRRYSSDSCWSFCKSSSGKGDAHSSSSSGSRSPSPNGSWGSSASNRKLRSSGHMLSLSGLCCSAADLSLSEDDDMEPKQGADQAPLSSGFLACMGSPAAVEMCQAQQQADSKASSVVSCSSDVVAGSEQPDQAADSTLAAESEQDTLAAVTALLTPLQPVDSNGPYEYTPSSAVGSPQQLMVRRISSSSQHGGDEASEEEHVAPLSLYAAMRESRRSRRLSRTGVLPNVQAALAAAAAAGRLDPSLYPSRLLSSGSGSSNSGDGNAQSGSDEERDAPSKGSPAGQQQQQTEAASDAASDGCSTDISSGQSTAAGSGKLSRASSELPDGGVAVQAAYGQRTHGRCRRHSYCYGTTSANYDAMCLSGASNLAAAVSQLRQQYAGTHASVSAAEAAAAIAAAAEAAREEINATRLEPKAPASAEQKGNGRRHRSRRMSCDDRLLLHLTYAPDGAAGLPAYSSEEGRSAVAGLGRLPLAMRRAGSSGAEYVGPAVDASAAALGKSRGRARRHSWTAAYLGDTLDAAKAASNLRALTACLLPVEQQQSADSPDKWRDSLGLMSQQLVPKDVSFVSSSSNSFGAADQQHKPVRANSGRMRRARRHSWTGFVTEQQALAAAALSSASRSKGPRRLSSCFTPLSMAVLGDEDADSPQKPGLHLPSCVGCCSDSSYLPLDDSEEEAQRSLLSGSQPSSAALADAGSSQLDDAGNMGCLGRFGAKPTSSKSHKQRRSSWCCSSTQIDTSLGPWSIHSSRSSSTEPLQPMSHAPSAALRPHVPFNRGASMSGRSAAQGRRSSWDGGHSRQPLDPVSAAVHPRQLQVSCQASAAAGSGSIAVDQLQQQKQSVDSSLLQHKAATASPGTAAAAAGSSCPGSSSCTATGESQYDGVSASQAPGTSVAACACLLGPSSLVQQQLADRRCVAAAEQILEQSHSPTAAASAGDSQQQQQQQHTAANRTQQPMLGRELSSELFTGSFDYKPTDGSKHSSRRSSMLSCNTTNLLLEQSIQSPLRSPAAVHSPISPPAAGDRDKQPPVAVPSSTDSSFQQDVSTAASSAPTPGPSKERRWSTGVAAHDLLLRQQALPKHLNTADGAKVRRASACVPGAFNDIFDAPYPAAAAVVGPSAGQVDSPTSGSLAAARQQVNVLGMPRKATVLGQRRMSYDTSTGAYHMVTKPPLVAADAARRLDAAADEQQQQQQAPLQEQQGGLLLSGQQHQPLTGAEQGQAQQQQPPQQQQQLQSEAQQHMQRLIEALAKKGYGGISFDNGSKPSSPQQQMPQQPLGALHSPTSPGPSTSAFDAAPATAAAATAAPAQAAGTGRRPSYCVPPAYSRPKYCAKVCDFGFSQCLRAGQSHCSTDAAGTITHQAPEVLKCGYLSPAADIYAFGIIMWELLTGERPFRGLLEGDVVYGVCETGLRPQFPPGAPEAFVSLAQQCWAQNASDRPTAGQLLKRLNEMLYEVRRQRQLNSSSSSSASRHPINGTPSSRPRRHSMPAVGAGRKRRASRRLSLFLPFARQPVAVPEHEPLEQAGPENSVGAFNSTSSSPAAAAARTTGEAAQAPAGPSSGASSSNGSGAAGLAAAASALLAGASNSWSFELGKAKVVRQPAAAVTGAPAGSGDHVLTTAETDNSGSDWFQSFD